MSVSLPTVDLGVCERLIVVSDVHLRAPHDELSALFFKTLESLEGPGILLFLGDVFDFIYADSSYFLKRWNRFFSIAADLRKKGLKVLFVEGNHDFGFHEPEGELSVFFDWSGDVEVVLRHPILGKVIARHGDDVVCKPGYERFRQLIKSRTVHRVLTHVPHRAIDWACLQWARLSRDRHETYQVDHALITSCLKKFIAERPNERSDVNTFIFGHIHVDAHFTLENGALFLSGPDWVMSPSILIADTIGVRRQFVNATGERAAEVIVLRDSPS